MKVGLCFCLNYEGTSHQVSGLDKSMEKMKEFLENKLKFDKVQTFYDKEATRNQFIQSVLENLADENVENLFIYRAGHGFSIKNENTTEKSGTDQGFKFWDSFLIDDKMREMLGRSRKNQKIFILTESCHSGTSCDLNFVYEITENGFEKERLYKRDIPAKVVHISGCPDDKSSFTLPTGGVLSTLFIKHVSNALEKPRLTYFDLINNLRQEAVRFQIPQITSTFKLDKETCFMVEKSNTKPFVKI